jgi:hypothetical protein
MLIKGGVTSDQIVRVTNRDISSSYRFLFESARSVNRRVGKRLETLLDALHREHPALFDAQDMADRVSRQLGYSITIDGSQGVEP